MNKRKFTSFEDLLAWQKARVLCREIYGIARVGDLSRDWALRDQICRSAVSIMSNIAEGWDRATAADTAHFLTIAKASCAELRCQLVIASDVGYIDQAQFDALNSMALEVSRIIFGLRKSFQKPSASRSVNDG